MIRDNMVAYRKDENGQWLREVHVKLLRQFGYTAYETTTPTIALAIATDAPFTAIQQLNI